MVIWWQNLNRKEFDKGKKMTKLIHNDLSQNSLIKAKALSYSLMTVCNSALQGWLERIVKDLCDATYVAAYSC